MLSRQPRASFVLSTKVGRVIHDEVENPAENLGALCEVVPAAFWRDLRGTGLLDPAAPLPAGA
ncbi:hypothetical protein [Microtetraspora sp. NBRC 16547]|uniref:hypothetical protein n=1 Tax=Microtetraspora sp. NBRC 16547 TaxID=3030993 RepID=UPI0024A04D70|nr:hypothetical protein [Microtetraspora sp. NBRC 16547]GLX01679.1 hypothetical protein Misp02_57650 [Microtetraspora sp. NBRC 16547]